MKNTTRFYNAVVSYRRDMKALQEEYAAELARLEQYMGSPYGNERKKLLDERTDARREVIRAEHRPVFNSILADMAATVKNKPMAAPTAEQLAILQLLTIRSNVSREELKQAANACANCPAAIEALREIASKNGLTLGLEYKTAGDPKHSVEVMGTRAGMLLGLPYVDGRRTWTNRGHADDDMRFFIDTDPTSEADAARIFGGVTDFDAFAAAVNE